MAFGEYQLSAEVAPHKAEPPLPLTQSAVARTEIALDPLPIKPMPIARRNDTIGVLVVDL